MLYTIRFYTRQFYAVVNNHIFEQITGSRTYDVLRFCVLPIVSLVHFLCMLLSARVPLARKTVCRFAWHTGRFVGVPMASGGCTSPTTLLTLPHLRYVY